MAHEQLQPVRDGTLILRIGLGGALFFALLVIVAWAMGVEVDPVPASEGSGPAASITADSGRVAVLGDLADILGESSGVAVSRAHAGTFWTHGDRPGEATLHALAFDGTEKGRVVVEGVRGEDWEDLALAPCPGGEAGDCLWFADIGDNNAERESVSVHVFREPAPVGDTVVPAVASVTFRYPEGPADAEALAVEPDGGLLVVTKGEDGTARLYRLQPATAARGQAPGGSATAGPSDEVAVAEAVGALSIDVGRTEDRITAAAVSPDGSTLALRTHVAIYLLDLARPLGAPRVCQLGRIQPQSEGMDFVDDSTFLLTSEASGGEAPIVSVRCP